MLFYGILVVIALALVVLIIRSPVIRQVRRGRGADHGGSARTHALDHTILGKTDPLGQPKQRDWE